MHSPFLSPWTGLLFGLIPALQTSRPDLSATLKESGGRSGTGFRQNKARTLLVISEVALAAVLLVGAALLIRTSIALSAVNPGFDADNVLTMRMSLAGPRFLKSASSERLVRDGVERLRALPECYRQRRMLRAFGRRVRTAVPRDGQAVRRSFSRRRRVADDLARATSMSSGYRCCAAARSRSATIAPRTRSSSSIRPWRNSSGPSPTRSATRSGSAKGVMSELAPETPRQIVGVVGDVRGGGLNRDPGATMYVPNAQVPDALNALNVRLTPMAWIVRTRGNPRALSSAIQEQLRQTSGLPVSDVRSMDEVISRSTSRQRFNMLLMTVFGSAALFIAAIGIYGLMAYSVQQRTQEIGIRLALGAESGHVRTMVVFQGMRLALIGVVIGIGVLLV